MNIAMTRAASPSFLSASGTSPAPKKEYQLKDDQRRVADNYEGSRSFGNGVAGLVTGAVVETLDAAVKSPLLAAKIAYDTARAETLGPNIKVLAALGAIPGAALSIVGAPFYGAYQGVKLMHRATRNTEDVLVKDASAEFSHLRFQTEDGKSMSSGFMKKLDELASKKLEPGQKKYDVPILAPLFAVGGAAISGIISGTVGLVAGLAAGLLTTGKEIVAGIKEGSIGRVAAAPLHTVAVPYGLVKEGLKESVPRGLNDGWKHGLVKPTVDTAKASVTLAKEVLKQAWER